MTGGFEGGQLQRLGIVPVLDDQESSGSGL